MTLLSQTSTSNFRNNGFLVIPGFFTEEQVDAATDAFDNVWRELPSDVTVDSELTGRRIRPKDVTPIERTSSMKVNDLYLRDEGLRQAVASQTLNRILSELMQDDIVLCNTLSVECGTQQADHLDTLFMTPLTPGKLLATWMALEDVEADAGPLRYYPESNHIEPFRFSGGGYHVHEPEFERWADYMADEVERHGLEETRFLAKKGDLLIWDAWLFHGGSEIQRPGASRKSVISHYFSKTDCVTMRSPMKVVPGGYWMDRAPQVPRDSLGSHSPDAPVAEGAAEIVAIPEVKAPMALRDRLDALDPEHH